MKKILSMLLVAVMLVVPVFAATDIENCVNEEAIKVLEDYGVIDGYEDGTYRPDKLISRAEVAKIMVAAITTKLPEKYNAIFTDVTAEDWYASYVEQAAELELIHGFGNGLFKPTANITFEQMCAIMLNALGYETTGDKYPTEVVAKAFELNLVDKIATRGTDFITRGEVAQMIYNALDLNLVEIYNGVAYPKAEKFGDNIGRKYTLVTVDNDVDTFGDIIKDYEREDIADELISTRVNAVYTEVSTTPTAAELLYGVEPKTIAGFVYNKTEFISVEDLLKKNVKFYLNGKELAKNEWYDLNSAVELIFVNDEIISVVGWKITASYPALYDQVLDAEKILIYGDEYIKGSSWLSYYGDFAVFVSNNILYAKFYLANGENYFKADDNKYYIRIIYWPLSEGISPRTAILQTEDDDISHDDQIRFSDAIFNGRNFIIIRFDYFNNLVDWELMD